MSDFRTKLGMELTSMDERASKRKGYNRYALAQYLAAADAVAEMVDHGVDPATAFADCFVPTAGTHRVARNLGLDLDVDRGRWTFTKATA